MSGIIATTQFLLLQPQKQFQAAFFGAQRSVGIQSETLQNTINLLHIFHILKLMIRYWEVWYAPIIDTPEAVY